MNKNEKINMKGWAFLPLITFLVIYLGSGLFFQATGVEEPFKQIPRITALFYGLCVALLMYRKLSFDDKMEIFTESAGESGVILMCVIFLLAGAFSGVAKSIGGVESTVNLGLTLVPRQFIIAGIFIIACFISLAMGTSMGTIAAIGPIAVGLAEKADLNMAVAIAAVVGGAMFGDNLSIISDTTIAACRGQGAEMRDKFKMNFLIALPAAIISIVLYSILGTSGELQGPFPYEIIKVIPYLGILIAALAGVNVLVVLILGIFLCAIIGLTSGSLTWITLAKSIGGGIEGMQGLAILSLMIRGLSGLVNHYGGIDWLLNLFKRNIKSRRGAELSIAALVSVLDAALANNTIAIIIANPMAKDISDTYGIEPKKTASILDIFSCVVQGLVPHGGQLLLACTLASLSPTSIMKYLFYPYLLGVAALIAMIFGIPKNVSKEKSIQKKA